MRLHRLHAPVCSLALALVPAAVLAAGTPAGTNIRNTATVNYAQNGAPKTAVSNTDVVRVAEILDVVVTVASPSVAAAAGAARAELVYTITNTGNGSEGFLLVPLSAGVPGDDFDPVLSTPAMYLDSDGSGDLSAGDVAYVPGGNDPVLPADGTVRVLVVNDIPAAAVDGSRGRSQLTASAVTGTGTAGTTFPGQGDGGVDAVAGTTEADSVETGEYVVETVSMSVVKSQTVADPFGGAQPVPGARINYRIVVTVAGSSTATASLLDDPIPVNTTYVPGTLALNGGGLSDAADADGGSFLAAPAPHVQVQLGDLTQGAGPQTIEFSVTIN
jgi:uncharacterized repeat protein (TIGR01451 family)